LTPIKAAPRSTGDGFNRRVHHFLARVDPMTAESGANERLDPDLVVRLCGDVLDGTVTAIAETGASLSDLEAAMAFLNGEDDAMGEEHRPLSGAAAVIYDLLAAEQRVGEER
jgi:hypothetical protein